MGGAAHQLALTSRHIAGWQTESKPLTGLGEPAGPFGTRATHIVLEIVSPIWLHRSRITLGVLLVPSGYPSKQPVQFVHHPEEKAKASLREPIVHYRSMIGLANTCQSGMLDNSAARFLSGWKRAQRLQIRKRKKKQEMNRRLLRSHNTRHFFSQLESLVF